MKKILLLLLAAVLLLAGSALSLNGNEVAVQAANDDMAGNEVSFETPGNNQDDEESNDENDQPPEQEKNRKMVDAGTKLALVIGSLISMAEGPSNAFSIGKSCFITCRWNQGARGPKPPQKLSNCRLYKSILNEKEYNGQPLI